jgi:hypothetical protein
MDREWRCVLLIPPAPEHSMLVPKYLPFREVISIFCVAVTDALGQFLPPWRFQGALSLVYAQPATRPPFQSASDRVLRAIPGRSSEDEGIMFAMKERRSWYHRHEKRRFMYPFGISI